ncbi:hypothetical protein B0J17DRAFT_661788 [Rhizoctonia solani]|nr:hypothetical protein B0J17DRAFT_661788 [Rhizoctonia solani]
MYRPLSLYPIFESSVGALNFSNVNDATATIHASLTPGLIYFRTQADVQSSSPGNVCDFIDDYRSGSVLDVIGSVGGLFALLQAVHLLLFGRPLFWGLSGAKLITPFGLLGKCSSRGFKRRLKDEYHSKSTEDGSDTIHIVKFLRDFVIEFGPADIGLEDRYSRPQATPSATPVAEEDAATAHVPLMLMESDATLAMVQQKDDGAGYDAKRSSDRLSVDRV